MECARFNLENIQYCKSYRYFSTGGNKYPAKLRAINQGREQCTSHAPHPRLLRPLLLRGEDCQQGARRLHGGRTLSAGRQHEQVLKAVFFISATGTVCNTVVRCSHSCGSGFILDPYRYSVLFGSGSLFRIRILIQAINHNFFIKQYFCMQYSI